MEQSNVLKNVAEQAGIADSYTNAWGNNEVVSDETLTRLLAALGYDTQSEKTLLASADKKHKTPILTAVKVVKDGEPIHIDLNLGQSARVSDFSWQLETEQGELVGGYLQSQIVADTRDEGGVLTFSLPSDLTLGYHKLQVLRRRRKSPYEMTLIIAPKACYKQSSIEQGNKSWGPSVQLYTLKTDHNWGIGDFGDLKQLVADIAARGGDFVGLNPIHSLFPANPEGASPYSPSSRRWLNLLYIDVTAVPEFALCSTAQERVGSNEFQQALHVTRATEWVDYSEVSRLKMSVLPLLFSEFQQRHLATNSSRAQKFLAFVEKGGSSLLHQASFDALHQQLHDKDKSVWGWQVFPVELRDINSDAVQNFIKQNQSSIQRYMYLQWIADEQIADVQKFALEQGMNMGLYRDLAVGVADSGAEVWADEGTLCQDVSIGAPPDVLGPLGQNWGLPPLNPAQLKATGYDAFIQLLRANMQHCGALRIDHVLGLLRLWLIPKGEAATSGAYMYYPVQDMLSILALESHRHQCAVIGEDLGTVPDEIVSLLSNAGIHSYKVFFFETAEDGGYFSPAHYQSQSMATLCTHDMPTLRGFWHCEDLKLGQTIGLYPDQAQLDGLFDARCKSKQEILNSVSWHGNLAESVGRNANYVPMDQALSNSLQLHLAAGSSSLLSLQLEDWLAMDKPVNVPGTVDEYPNWRRKLSATLDDMFSCPNVNYLAAELTAARAKACDEAVNREVVNS
ncbi:4-alpha-glucanotransferase [Moritella viscosa]|uniref:4-alpha-glucanotransferase n=1 Tax=Moritella viscosa TaxID=80854 RepID=A0ABY1HAU9_9GAMM|nr:4-alpha-glucanotransferase [Moritella viscosa]SGY85410.1 4-alpha-glucanotransferase [Moritella viscosa]SGY87711.1 4-alpha-glucanotransferase [Moritella viscosa]SHO24754.1 4-alpha-glucanotransferase [Moritella viscosa]